jgi:hypothetical protein
MLIWFGDSLFELWDTRRFLVDKTGLSSGLLRSFWKDFWAIKTAAWVEN